MALSYQRLEEVVGLLGNRVVAFHPKLVAVTGRVTTGLMLSQSIYWSRKLASTQSGHNGWFWKRRQDWRAETGLSRDEQETARRELRQAGIIDEQTYGMPAKKWFRVNLDHLAKRIDSEFTAEWDWRNEAQTLKLLGRPILFHRPLATITNSVTGAILLSMLLADERASVRAGKSGWRRFENARAYQVTGLTRHELMHARETLRDINVLTERVVGVPPRLEIQLNLDELAKQLQAVTDKEKTISNPQFARNQQTDYPETRQLEKSGQENLPRHTPEAGINDECIGKSLINPQFARNQHTDYPETRQLIIRKPANKTAENRKIGWRESGQIYKGLTTVNLINPPPTPSDSTATTASNEDGGWWSSLIWPENLLLPERSTALLLLRPVAYKAQVLLDELAGQHASSSITRPLAYLRKLAAQEVTGQFIPTVAHRIAARREQMQIEAEQRRKAVRVASVDSRSAENDEQKRQQARQRLEQMMRMLGRGNRMAAGGRS